MTSTPIPLLIAGACYPALYLLLACDLGQMTVLPQHHFTALHFWDLLSNESCDFNSFVWVYWNCSFNQNDPGGFYLPKVRALMLRELVVWCGWLVQQDINLQMCNLIHQLQAPQHTERNLLSVNPKIFMSRHIIIKLLKPKDKEKNILHYT